MSYSGDAADVQLVRPVFTTGAEGSRTVVALDTDGGSKSAGTQRVVIATDQPALTTPVPINLKQLNGAAIATTSDTTILKVGIADSGGNGINNGQGTMSLSVPVAIASDQTALATKGDTNAAATATWSTATTTGTVVTLATTGYSSVAASYHESDSGTAVLTGGVVTFEGSDDAGTTWYPLVMARTTSGTLDATYALAGGKQLWQAGCGGITNVRARLSTAITQGAGTGTASAILRLQASAAAGSYEVTCVQATASSLNATANVSQFGGTAVDTNSGNKGAGTLRVTLATDQVQLTNKLLVDPGGSAPTKTARTIVSSQSCSAGGTVSGTLDLTTKRGCMVTMRVTNGGTGPTVACTATVNYSTDNSTWRKAVAFTAGTTNSGVYDFSFEVSEKVMYLQISFTGNTAQAVTVESYGHEYTSG